MAHTKKWTDDDLKSGIPVLPSAEQRQIDVLTAKVNRLARLLDDLRGDFERHLDNRQ